jgi:hypothetical protein
LCRWREGAVVTGCRKRWAPRSCIARADQATLAEVIPNDAAPGAPYNEQQALSLDSEKTM